MVLKKDPELKGEHFHGNNPDMKLDFSEVSEADISAMERSKGRGYPITKNEAIDAPGNQKEQQFMASDGTGDVGPRKVPVNAAWMMRVKMTGTEEDLPEP
tara:strand:+ start:5697 stop:5996 length:300 start_codon:yes stop_codon:yes gene_type:complete